MLKIREEKMGSLIIFCGGIISLFNKKVNF